MVNLHNVKVDVANIDDRLLSAIALIKKFIKINNIYIKPITVCIDMNDRDNCGYYSYANKDKYNLYINPLMCEDVDQKNGDHYPYSYNDLSMFGVTIHEFCHLISNVVFVDMQKEFNEKFATRRLFLNNNSTRSADEEWCEAAVVYITNPHLLKLISKDHWSFFKSHFKSPIACTRSRFEKIYDEFPWKVKDILQSRWGIIINSKTNKAEKANKE